MSDSYDVKMYRSRGFKFSLATIHTADDKPDEYPPWTEQGYDAVEKVVRTIITLYVCHLLHCVCVCVCVCVCACVHACVHACVRVYVYEREREQE